MERIFDEVLFINQGSIMLHSNVETLRAERGKSLEDIFKEVFYDA